MITNGKYVSVNTIISKVYRDMGMHESINIADAVEWCGEALEFIGATLHLIEKVEAIDIKEFRGKLPCDLHFIQTCSAKEVGLATLGTCDINSMSFTQMRYSTDAYHHWKCGKSDDCKCTSVFTYKINDDFMFTNFEEGKVLISYYAIPTDKDGFPKIPDDVKFKEAVSAHLKWRLGFIKWIEGKLPQAVYQKLEQDRDWYIGAAQNRDKMPGLDMMEAIKNNWLRLIPKINQHNNGFKDLGNPEERYTHNSQ